MNEPRGVFAHPRMRFFFLLCFPLLVLCSCGGETPSTQKGRQAPDFTLPTVVEDEKITLSEWTEQGPVLIVFWASWCPPCVQEIPILNEWHDKYGSGKPGLKIIAVNVQETREKVISFMKENPIHYPVALDTEGTVSSLYGIVGLPVAVALAKGGEIIYYGFTLPEIGDLIESESV